MLTSNVNRNPPEPRNGRRSRKSSMPEQKDPHAETIVYLRRMYYNDIMYPVDDMVMQSLNDKWQLICNTAAVYGKVAWYIRNAITKKNYWAASYIGMDFDTFWMHDGYFAVNNPSLIPCYVSKPSSIDQSYSCVFEEESGNLVVRNDNNDYVWGTHMLVHQTYQLIDHRQVGIVVKAPKSGYMAYFENQSSLRRFCVKVPGQVSIIWEITIPDLLLGLRYQYGVLKLLDDSEDEYSWASSTSTLGNSYYLTLDDNGALTITDGANIAWGSDRLAATDIALQQTGIVIRSAVGNFTGYIDSNVNLIIRRTDQPFGQKVGEVEDGAIIIKDCSKIIWRNDSASDFYFQLIEVPSGNGVSTDFNFVLSNGPTPVWVFPSTSLPTNNFVGSTPQLSSTLLPSAPNMIVSDDRTRVTKDGSTGWNATAVSSSVRSGVHRWRVRLTYTASANILIGIAPENIDQSKTDNYLNNGWYFYCKQSNLYSGPPQNYVGYSYSGTGQLPSYTTVDVILDVKNKTIAYGIADYDYAVAYSGIYTTRPLRLVLILQDDGDYVDLLSHTVY